MVLQWLRLCCGNQYRIALSIERLVYVLLLLGLSYAVISALRALRRTSHGAGGSKRVQLRKMCRNTVIAGTISVLCRVCYETPVKPVYRTVDNGLGVRYGVDASAAVQDRTGSPLWNPHASLPRSCGEAPPALPPRLQPFVEGMWSAQERLTRAGGPRTEFAEIIDNQICQYAILDRIQQMLEDRGVTRWSASHGTGFGLHCLGSMLPYDKDIDLIMQCSDLTRIWDDSPEVAVLPDGTEQRAASEHLLMEFNWAWYATLTLKNIPGNARPHPIDIFCYPSRNPFRRVMRGAFDRLRSLLGVCLALDKNELWTATVSDYLATDGPLYEAEFGPTTVRTVPTHVADHATQVEFGVNGVGQTMGCMLANATSEAEMRAYDPALVPRCRVVVGDQG